MPLEGQSTLLLLYLSCFYTCLRSCLFFQFSFFLFLLFFFSGKLYLNCAYTQASQVFSLGVSSYPRLENIDTCHSAWVTSVKALFYFYHRLTPLFPCVYIIACCSVAFDLAYFSANNLFISSAFYNFVKEIFIRCNPC